MGKLSLLKKFKKWGLQKNLAFGLFVDGRRDLGISDLIETDPERVNVLIINEHLTYKILPSLKKYIEHMPNPHWIFYAPPPALRSSKLIISNPAKHIKIDKIINNQNIKNDELLESIRKFVLESCSI